MDGPCVLFQVGLALFKITENEIMTMRDELGSGISPIMQKKALEDYDFFFKVPNSPLPSDRPSLQAFWRVSHTMVLRHQVALKDFASITMDKVQQLRNSYKLQVIIDLEEEKRRYDELDAMLSTIRNSLPMLTALPGRPSGRSSRGSKTS